MANLSEADLIKQQNKNILINAKKMLIVRNYVIEETTVYGDDVIKFSGTIPEDRWFNSEVSHDKIKEFYMFIITLNSETEMPSYFHKLIGKLGDIIMPKKKKFIEIIDVLKSCNKKIILTYNRYVKMTSTNIRSQQRQIEFIDERSLFPLMEHVDQPKMRLLTQVELLDLSSEKKSELAKMKKSDAVANYFDAVEGDVFYIIREIAGISTSMRLVIKDV